MSNDSRLTPEEIETLSDRSRAARDSALEALSLMRTQGLSLSKAIRRVGISRETMLKYAGHALEKTPSGQLQATPEDRIVRRMKFPTRSGITVVPIEGSRDAEKVSRYWRAVDEYLKTGNPDEVFAFEDEFVEAEGQRHFFLTDLETLQRNAQAGEVRFEDIYEDS